MLLRKGFPAPVFTDLMVKLRNILLLIILLADLSFSFYQHCHMPLYGDMADVILPSPGIGYSQVLHDPFGLNALLKNEIYPNPNRFFAHWTASEYFLNVPLLLQNFTDPISSIYLSSAIAKTIIQVLIIYLLAIFISNTGNLFKLEFLIAAVLVTPLFQTSGFNRYMGIIDQSVIYTFFYALPLGLLLLFFLPFFKFIYYDERPKSMMALKILWVLLVIFLSLNGPLIPGIVLIACPLVLLSIWLKNYKQLVDVENSYKRGLFSIKKIPGLIMFFFIGFCIFSLYSLYLGRNNILNEGTSIHMMDRFSALPKGLYNIISKKIGIPLLLFTIIINVIAISKYYKSPEGQKIIKLLKWIGVFSVIYILLLPLGGFRSYREHIIRYDTIMPVTLGLIFSFGFTSLYLIRHIPKKNKAIYLSGIFIILLIFTTADSLNTKPYECEKSALETIAESSEKIVALECDCPVMDWHKISDAKNSERNAVLLNYWNITKEKKLYYHRVTVPNPNNLK